MIWRPKSKQFTAQSSVIKCEILKLKCFSISVLVPYLSVTKSSFLTRKSLFKDKTYNSMQKHLKAYVAKVSLGF